jgi:sugar lactone lactonase YvrE
MLVGILTLSLLAATLTACGDGTKATASIAVEVTTLAGQTGSIGTADGSGAAARFAYLAYIACDAAGNLYVTDYNTIRKITPAGKVTTFAGKPGDFSYGSANGSHAAARFDHPFGIACDTAGNVYVAEEGNYTVRKITPAGEVTTLAGRAGSSGTVDGSGAAARFSGPNGIACDAAGNLYVVDWDAVRKITPAGKVTTLAGKALWPGHTDGSGAAARFRQSSGIACDAAGNIYVADTTNDTIRKITPAGEVTTLAGKSRSKGSIDGSGAAARFNWPTGISCDFAGNLYVTDSGNNTIRKITPAGEVTTLAGKAGAVGSADGSGTAARFSIHLNGIACDAAGNLYVADCDNNTIRKITLSH